MQHCHIFVSVKKKDIKISSFASREVGLDFLKKKVQKINRSIEIDNISDYEAVGRVSG